MPGTCVWVTAESKWTGAFVASDIKLKFLSRITAAGRNVIAIIPGQFKRVLEKVGWRGFLLLR